MSTSLEPRARRRGTVRWSSHARASLAILLLGPLALACSGGHASTTLGPRERAAIADTVRQRLRTAADLSHGDVVARLMSLYPDTGTVISASAGHVTTTRAALQQQIQQFWTNIGQNMRNPRWEWDSMHVDVLAPDAAVVTSTYRIPHLTPRGMPHVVGGAWTAVFQRRGGKWVIVQEHLSDFQPIG
ncbi:MAG TPA: nuclear transport factor 2 family protein [Gemmatimonadaceae bacterium]|nr:nuclear transport factor 2 family protein [Gemmatimonadaceae bacterium]